MIEGPVLQKAVVRAVLASAGWPGATFLVLMMFFGGSTPDLVRLVVGLTFFVGLPVALVGCLFVGIPAHLTLSRLRWTSMWSYVLTGFCVGAIPALVASVTGDGAWDVWKDVRNIPALFLIFTVMAGGPIAALIFWKTTRPNLKRTKPLDPPPLVE